MRYQSLAKAIGNTAAAALLATAVGCNDSNNAQRLAQVAAAGAGTYLPGGRCVAWVAKSAGQMPLLGASIYQQARSREEQAALIAAQNRTTAATRGGILGLAAIYPSAAGAAGTIVNNGTVGFDLPYGRVAVCNSSEPNYVDFSPTGTTALVLCKDGQVNQVTVSPECVAGLASPIDAGHDPVKVAFTEDGQYAFIANRGDGTMTILEMTQSVVTNARAGVIGAGIYSENTKAAQLIAASNRRLQVEDMVVRDGVLYVVDSMGQVHLFDIDSMLAMQALNGSLNAYGWLGDSPDNGMGPGRGNNRLALGLTGVAYPRLGGPATLFGGSTSVPGIVPSTANNAGVKRLASTGDGRFLLSLTNAGISYYSMDTVAEVVRAADGTIMVDGKNSPIEQAVAPGMAYGLNRTLRIPGAREMSWRGQLGVVIAEGNNVSVSNAAGSGARVHVVVQSGASMRDSSFVLAGVRGAVGVSLQPSAAVKVREVVTPVAESDNSTKDNTKDSNKTGNGTGFTTVQ